MTTSNHTPKTLEIQLTKEQIAIVDDVDYEYVSQFKWYAMKTKSGYYACRTFNENGIRHTELLHRVILASLLGRLLEKGEECDHVNGNTLDNTRNNLRLASHSQNTRNRKTNANSTTGIKGVWWNKKDMKWQAGITVDGKLHYLGRFSNVEDAKKAYEQASKKFHGDFGRLA